MSGEPRLTKEGNMRRTTFIAALLVAVLVIGYGGWLSSVSSAKPGSGSQGATQTDQNDQTGKPGEAPKE
jgi:hypothetical protein